MYFLHQFVGFSLFFNQKNYLLVIIQFSDKILP
jgi:hypothetical protein